MEELKILEDTEEVPVDMGLLRDKALVTINNNSNHKLQTWAILLHQKPERWQLPLSHKRMKMKDGEMPVLFLTESSKNLIS